MLDQVILKSIFTLKCLYFNIITVSLFIHLHTNSHIHQQKNKTPKTYPVSMHPHSLCFMLIQNFLTKY